MWLANLRGVLGFGRPLAYKRKKGKRALITGGTSGIGLEIAPQFLKEGARLVVAGRNPAALEAARKELGSEVLVVSSDAGNADTQKELANMARLTFGGLDVLFVNAGITDMRPIEHWDEVVYDRSFTINLKGPFFLIQAPPYTGLRSTR